MTATPLHSDASTTDSKNRLPNILVAISPYLVYLVILYYVFAMTVDDAYITFRYAHNIIAGHGPVFNVGERVEGFTSPFHLLLSVGMLLVFPVIDILFNAKTLSTWLTKLQAVFLQTVPLPTAKWDTLVS